MSRPTAYIRQVLLLQMMEDMVHRALVQAKKDLADQNVKIVSMNESQHDITVQYIADNHNDEGIYMRKMLEAEVRGYLRRMPDVKRHLEEPPL